MPAGNDSSQPDLMTADELREMYTLAEQTINAGTCGLIDPDDDEYRLAAFVVALFDSNYATLVRVAGALVRLGDAR